MATMYIFFFLLQLNVTVYIATSNNETTEEQETSEEEPKKFLDHYNKNFPLEYSSYYTANWNYYTNMTQHNAQVKSQKQREIAHKVNKLKEQAQQFNTTGMDEDTKRQFKLLLQSKLSRNRTISEQRSRVRTQMKRIYSSGTVMFDPDVIKSVDVGEGVVNLSWHRHLKQIMKVRTSYTYSLRFMDSLVVPIVPLLDIARLALSALFFYHCPVVAYIV